MRILITNDDGISSPVLPYFVAWAKTLGDVTVVAPKFEQSGKSQAIDFRNKVEIVKSDILKDTEAWSVDSTPADCVRFAVKGLKRAYDLVFSGINRGYNLGHDIAYSGTVGSVFEAARLGIRAIAISSDPDDFSTAVENLSEVYSCISENRLFDYAHILNVNIPRTPPKGVLITRQGGAFYSDDYVSLGSDRYIQVGEPLPDDTSDLTSDISAVHHGYISVTPLTEIRTDFEAYKKLADSARLS